MFDENIPIKIFTSYAHKDEDLREELDVHLAMIKRHAAIEIWNDRAINPGDEWDDSIKKELNSANIILLLFTPRFLASRYIYEVELKTAIERHKKKEARVIPVIIKPCDWTETEFGALQAVPNDAKPVTKWDDMDEAFYNVAQQLKDAINATQKKIKSKG